MTKISEQRVWDAEQRAQAIREAALVKWGWEASKKEWWTLPEKMDLDLVREVLYAGCQSPAHLGYVERRS